MAASSAFRQFGAVITHGIRPIGIRAALSSWIGQQIALTDHDFWQQFLGGGSFTGKSVSAQDALKLSTVWACVRLISETLSTLPLGFYQRQKDGSRRAATEHSLYELLHNSPNADMTAAVFWQCVVASMLLWGNAYIEIRRSVGAIVALNFLAPHCMSVRKFDSGAIEYRYASDGSERVIAVANMMHIRAFSLDGLIGLSAVQYGVNVMGTAIETDRASAETFMNSTRASGMVQMGAGKFLTSPQREQIRAHVKKVAEDGGVYVFEGGTKFDSFKFNPVDAELLASREYNVAEICRWFGVDPAMVGHGGKDSNWGTGLEQKMLWFLVFSLRKWCVRIEQSIRKDLIARDERAQFFASFAIEGLLRGDSAARSTFYSTMVQNGIYTRNEVRALENLAPKDGGNELTAQTNLAPLRFLGAAGASKTETSLQEQIKQLLGIA